MIVRTCRPDSLLLGVSSVIMGWGAATVHGNGEVLPGILCLFFAIFMQLYNNWAHRYYDIKYQQGETRADGYDLSDNDVQTTYSMMNEISKGALILAGMVGLGIMMLAGVWTLAIGILVFAFAWFNSHGETPLLRTPANIAITFLVFGPLGVIGTEIVQSSSGHSSFDVLNSSSTIGWWFDLGGAIILSIPAGLMAVNAHLAHGFRKHDEDVSNNKKTATVMIGRRNTAILYLVNAIIVPLSFVLFYLTVKPAPPLWMLMLAPILVSIFMISRYKLLMVPGYDSTRIIERETAIAFLLLALCTYILCLTTGTPNDSPLRFYN